MTSSLPLLGRFMYRNGAALIIAVCVGLVTALPQIIQRVETGERYQGVAVRGTDTEEYYLIRIREAYDGHWRVASPDLYEYKQAPFVQPSIPEIVMGGAARLLGLNIIDVVVAAKFLFPFLLSLVLYALVCAMTGQTLLALLIPPAIVMAGQTLVSPTMVLRLLRLQAGAFTAMVDYARPVNPQFSSFVFFLWLWLWYTWARNPLGHLRFVAGAALLGLMVYVYPYAWMLGIGIVGLTFLASLFPRFRQQGMSPVRAGIYAGVSLFFTIPYWINFYRAFTHPVYEALQRRYGFYASREPIWSDLLFFDLLFLLVLYWRRKKDETFCLLLSFIAVIALLTNQQVITGLRFYPGHWHWYYTTPLTIFLLIWGMLALLRHLRWLRSAVAAIIIMGSFTIGIAKQTTAFARLRASAEGEQRFAAPLQWLETHTQKDTVVMANGIFNELLPAYTHANAYFSRWGEFYLVPHERFRDRMFARLYLDGADEENIDQFVTGDRKDVYEYLFGRYRLRKGECEGGCFDVAELRRVKEEYLAWRADVDFEAFLKRYRLDYAIWDTQTNASWQLDQYPFFEFVTEVNGIRVYKFHSPS